MEFGIVGFLKIFAQLIGISTPPSKRKNEQVARHPTSFAEAEKDRADENRQKDKAQ